MDFQFPRQNLQLLEALTQHGYTWLMIAKIEDTRERKQNSGWANVMTRTSDYTREHHLISVGMITRYSLDVTIYDISARCGCVDIQT